MEIKTKKLTDLKPAPYNPRTISDKAMAGLRASIDRFGLVEPIVFNKRSGNVIGGHQRLKVLEEQGIKKTKVVVVDLPKREEKVLNVALNNPHITGEFVPDLQNILEGFKADIPDAFEALNLDELYLPGPKAGNTDPDDVPASAPATAKLGEIWLLGKHRVMCGDSTKAEDVEALMQGEKAETLVTDPPYGVDLNAKNLRLKKYGRGKDWGDLQGDVDIKNYPAFIESFIVTIKQYIEVGGSFFIWYAILRHGIFDEILTSQGLLIYRNIIWVKPHFVLANLPFHWRHEGCLYGWHKGHKARIERIPTNETTVWEVDYDGRKMGSGEHPTSKPVKLMAKCVKYGAAKDAIVLDPFLGSGSTLIACEQLDRICYGMEIEPKYCDVIIKRWEEFTGAQARKSK